MFQQILLLFGVSFGVGALPLVGWITRLLAHKNLHELGTGNIGVSAAFYHGGTIVGILAVLVEAAKGIGVVLLARALFPYGVQWEQAALILLVLGRFSLGGGAGTTNVAWGYLVHDTDVAMLVILIGVGSLTVIREKRSGKWLVLALLPVVTAFIHPSDGMRTGMAMLLSLLMVAIYQQIPDDLELDAVGAKEESRSMFRFFQGTRSVLTLDQPLDPATVGAKAATLATLKRSGYPVPKGWVIRAGDDPEPLIEAVKPSPANLVVARSSAVGEDELNRSAAGQYVSLLNIRDGQQLYGAINRCLRSYYSPTASQYREDRGAEDSRGEAAENKLSVLVQTQVAGVFSGVAFSRDPIAQQGEAVIIEALPGGATQVVSGQFTPESYRVYLPPNFAGTASWRLPKDLALTVERTGTFSPQVPERIIERVAYLARHLENYFHGIPQDMEWSYDGEKLWLLQCRPITNLTPIWTRKIAAEVIPGCIRPLTWSINRPLTCGVWGTIFKIVLGNDRSEDLDFTETATLHFGHAYFNATLLGEIFRRMGLPPESLEFLTRGAKFSKPPLVSTLSNVPGLFRLAVREWRLLQDFAKDDRAFFQPLLNALSNQPLTHSSTTNSPHPPAPSAKKSEGEPDQSPSPHLGEGFRVRAGNSYDSAPDSLPDSSLKYFSPRELLDRSDRILQGLERVTYYSILAPLSFALRQTLFKVPLETLDNRKNPEVAALKELKGLAIALRETSKNDRSLIQSALQSFLQEYGYLSEVGTDIAVPTWQEQPEIVENLLLQFLDDTSILPDSSYGKKVSGFGGITVQQRLDLKGQVTIVYSRLLAELRACFVTLEQQWITSGLLQQSGDIFYLEFTEIKTIVSGSQDRPHPPAPSPKKGEGEPDLDITQKINDRRQHFTDYQTLTIPSLVYGFNPPDLGISADIPLDRLAQPNRIQGIGASQGIVEGVIKRVKSFQSLPQILATIDRQTILVVPYTDSGWAPLLAQAGGLIAEVGGQLSHGAIVAREYGIPAVMNVSNALNLFQDGDRVRLDGSLGTIDRDLS